MVLTRSWSGEQGRPCAGIVEAPTLRELGRLLAEATRPFGITAFAIGHLQGGEQPATIFLTAWPRAWMELYAANAFITDDGVVAEALALDEPFFWAELRNRRTPAGASSTPPARSGSRTASRSRSTVPGMRKAWSPSRRPGSG